MAWRSIDCQLQPAYAPTAGFAAAVLAGVAVSSRTSSGVEPVKTASVALPAFDEAAATDGTADSTRGRYFVGVGGCSASN